MTYFWLPGVQGNYYILYGFPRVTITNFQNLNSLSNINVLSHNSGGQKSKIKVLVGLVLSGGCEGESIHTCVLASGSCQKFLVFLSLRHITPISVSTFSWPSLLCVCVSNLLFSLIRIPVIRFSAPFKSRMISS